MDWLYRTSPSIPLPAPFPLRGFDPTTDGLDCRVAPAAEPPRPTNGFETGWQGPRALTPGDRDVPFHVIATTRGATAGFSIAYRVRNSVLTNVRVDFEGTIIPRGTRSVLQASPFFRWFVLPSSDPDFSLLLVSAVWAADTGSGWDWLSFDPTEGRVTEAPLFRVVGDVRTNAPIGIETNIFTVAPPEDFVAAGDFLHGVQNEFPGFGDGPGGFISIARDDDGVVLFDGEEFLRGDSNGSLQVDIADAQFTLGFLFQGTSPPICFDPADANDDGAVDISDATFTLGFLFLGSEPPPDPGPQICGFDLTVDPFRECPEICP